MFQVPLMERAIALEEERAASVTLTGANGEESGAEVSLGVQRIGMLFGTAIFGAIVVLALIMSFAFPGNPDPVPVPIDLLELFRALTKAGQFLIWALLAAGVTVALLWHQRSESARTSTTTTATSLGQ